jgi:primosomal protein N' (replication factor Y)
MDIRPGALVRVPFGAQTLSGIVFSLSEASPLEATRPVIEAQAGGPLISPARLDLARWTASHYRTTLYLASTLMLPAGAVARQRTWLTLAEPAPAPPEDLRPGEQRGIRLARAHGRIRKDRLARSLGTGGNAIVDRLVRRGFFNTASETERPARPRLQDHLALAIAPEAARLEAERLRGTRSVRRGALLDWLAAGNAPGTKAGMARRFGEAAVKALLASGQARLERVRVRRDPLRDHVIQQSFAPDPTPEQAAAISAVSQAIEKAQPGQPARKFLLFGVTGAGKTEVYLRAVQACLNAGRRAIILVPEIALTPQTLRRFASRFPGKIALQHSGLSEGQRFDQWWEINNGDYPMVLGSRSAVFAPLEDLGLVVMDEEHEWTYKQSDLAPRYHARDAAERLCSRTGAVLLCGSATPDLTTFRMAERGDYALLRLPRRLVAGEQQAAPPGGRPDAGRVETVDMREELRAGHVEVFSRPLISALRQTISRGERAVLFINRRGTASFVQCRNCGAVRKCRRCDTTLTYHRAGTRSDPGRLVCHYCGYSIRSTRGCQACGGVQMLRLGAGTQAVADAVQAYFPRAGVVRWDSDTARTAKEHEEVLRRFESGESRVLVGTQLVAKGLDIPEVTLVAVVSADIGLAVPDFRAAERTFQLLTQAAGRAGRGPRGGSVIFQTFQPEHYAIRAAAREDYEAFYRAEMAVRAEFAYPPFTRLVRLVYSDPDAAEAERAARDLAARLERERSVSGDTGNSVVGPTPPYPPRLRGRYRWQIVLRGPEPAGLLDKVPPGRGWTVDVDPASLA